MKKCSKECEPIEKEDQQTLLKVKSLLNQMSYFIKEEHKQVLEDYHRFCRKYCKWEKD